MATTWDLVSITKGSNNIWSLTVQEVIDGVPGQTYTASGHKTDKTTAQVFIDRLKVKLKKIILEDRTKKTKEALAATKFDLTTFETFINS